MSRNFLIMLILLLVLNINVSSQITDPPPNIKVTDIYGNFYNLYTDMLSEGKYVFMDFFTNTCTFCQYYAPMIDSAYRFFGCGCNNIDFWALNKFSGSDNQSVMEFTLNFGISFSAFSAEGGSAYSANLYNIPYTPYFLLISPDTSIVMDNPHFENSQQLIDTLLSVGFVPSECKGTDFKYFEIRTVYDTLIGHIDNTQKKIYVSVPDTVSIDNAKAFFILSSNAVAYIDGEEQISDSTVNDFSQGVIYTVYAEVDTIWSQWEVIPEFTPTPVKNVDQLIYPNPTDDFVFVSDELIGSYYWLYNSEGKLLKIKKLKNKKIDLSGYVSGVYYIVLNNGRKFHSIKLLKR